MTVYMSLYAGSLAISLYTSSRATLNSIKTDLGGAIPTSTSIALMMAIGTGQEA